LLGILKQPLPDAGGPEEGSWNALFDGPDPVFGESSEFDSTPMAPVGFEIDAYVALVKRRIAVLRLEFGGPQRIDNLRRQAVLASGGAIVAAHRDSGVSRSVLSRTVRQ
jgi:hypothetical protein